MSGFLDTSGRVTRAQAAAAKAAGYDELLRCVGGTQPLTREERADCLAEGVRVIGAYQMFRRSDFSRATGAQDGRAAIVQAAVIDPGEILAVDLEGGAEPWEDYLDGWLSVVWPEHGRNRSGGTGKVLQIWIYLGVGAAQALTTAVLDKLAARYVGIRFWTPYSAAVRTSQRIQDPSAGYVAEQVEPNITIGIGAGTQVYDRNVYGTATVSPVATTAPPPPERFTFALRPGESVGDRVARCWEEALAGGPMGHRVLVNGQWKDHPRAEWYRSFINATTPAGTMAGAPVSDISPWTTSCLISQEGADHHCGGTKAPPRNGAGFFEVYPASLLRMVPPMRGDRAYVRNTGTDGHVVCVLERLPDGTYLVAAGGGGDDGTQCSIYVMKADARGFPHDHRAYGGCWRASEAGLPSSPPVDASEATTLPPQSAPEQPEPPAAPVAAPVVRRGLGDRRAVAHGLAMAGASALAAVRAHPIVTVASLVLLVALVALAWYLAHRRPNG